MPAGALELDTIRFTYRGTDRPALDGLSLTLAEGSSLWLLGRSGSGRSTLSLVPNRIVPLHHRGVFSGSVRLFGEDVGDKSIADLAGVVGQVFQDFESQIFGTRVDLEVAFGCENLGVSPTEIRSRVGESLERVGLAGFGSRDPVTLSGGEKQRLVIASVLAMRPRLLVLDEPTTDLDPVGRAVVWEILRELEREGTTTILVEPETEEADLGERLAVLREGRIVADGETRGLLSKAAALSSQGLKPPDLALLSERLGLDPASWTVQRVHEAALEAGWRVDGGLLDTRLRELRARSPEPGAEILRFEGVSHTFPTGVEALAGIDLRVREGEFIAILGANGSGKTTLMQAACGLLAPSRGRILLDGRDIAEIPARERGRRLGFVFQNPDHQIFSHSVSEEVSFAPRNFGLAEPEVERAVSEALDTVGLTGDRERDPFVMTRGDRQRVAVASVLAAGPRVIVMDEPTTGLDHRDQGRMMAILSDLRARGRTVIVVTHAVGLAAEWADRLVVMDRGRIVADGVARDLIGAPGLETRSAIRPPGIVRLAARMGAPLATPADLAAVLVRPGRKEGR